jgi:hypothetical protein
MSAGGPSASTTELERKLSPVAPSRRGALVHGVLGLLKWLAEPLPQPSGGLTTLTAALAQRVVHPSLWSPRQPRGQEGGHEQKHTDGNHHGDDGHERSVGIIPYGEGSKTRTSEALRRRSFPARGASPSDFIRKERGLLAGTSCFMPILREPDQAEVAVRSMESSWLAPARPRRAVTAKRRSNT